MTNYFRKFRLLLWKNFLLQKRRPIGTAFEIIIPIVVMGILILIPLTSDKAKDRCFSVFKSKDIDLEDSYYDSSKPLAVFPPTKIVSELMARVEKFTDGQLKVVNSSIATGEPWSSGASMAVEVSQNGDKYFGAQRPDSSC